MSMDDIEISCKRPLLVIVKPSSTANPVHIHVYMYNFNMVTSVVISQMCNV